MICSQLGSFIEFLICLEDMRTTQDIYYIIQILGRSLLLSAYLSDTMLNLVKRGAPPRGPRALPTFGTIKTSAFSTNAQSRFASVVLDGVLGPRRLGRHS